MYVGGYCGFSWYLLGFVLCFEQVIDDYIVLVMDLVDEDVVGDIEFGGVLQLVGLDGFDVFELQLVIVLRIVVQCFFVDVEDGVYIVVVVYVIGDLLVLWKVGFDDFG